MDAALANGSDLLPAGVFGGLNLNLSLSLSSAAPPAANATSEVPVIPAYIRTASTVVCVIIMSIGVAGNAMVPAVILRSRDMRNSTNIFLVNLSVADLLVLLVCTPTVLVEVHSRPEVWVLGETMCKAVPFVELTVAHASVLTILAISFERYYAICEPLRAGYVCTKARALLICLLAWALAALLTSPMLAISQFAYHPYADGSLVPTCLSEAALLWQKLFFTVSSAAFFAVPVAVLLALYGRIARHLMAPSASGGGAAHASHAAHACAAPAPPPEPGGNSRARRQVVLMLAAVVLAFFLCLLPFRAFSLWIVFASSASVHALGIEAYYSLLYFCRTMFYLNSAVNPILYSLMSSKFRAGFARLFGYRERQAVALLRGADGEMRNGAGRRGPWRQHRSAPDLFAWRSGSRSSLASVRSAAPCRPRGPPPPKRAASDAGAAWRQRGRLQSFRRHAVLRSAALSFDLDGRPRDAAEPLNGNGAADTGV